MVCGTWACETATQPSAASESMNRKRFMGVSIPNEGILNGARARPHAFAISSLPGDRLSREIRGVVTWSHAFRHGWARRSFMRGAPTAWTAKDRLDLWRLSPGRADRHNRRAIHRPPA